MYFKHHPKYPFPGILMEIQTSTATEDHHLSWHLLEEPNGTFILLWRTHSRQSWRALLPQQESKPRKAMLQRSWEGAELGTRCAPQTLLLAGVPHSAALCCKNPGDSCSLLAAIINVQVQQQCSWTSKTTPPLTVPQILVTSMFSFQPLMVDTANIRIAIFHILLFLHFSCF